MLARHREKMGNYYLGGETAKPEPEEGGKKKKKGKKGAPEALPAPPPPEPEMPAYMKASMAGFKMARPEIKGESDSESDEDEAPAKGAGKKALYAPKNSSAALHAGLGGYDPLKPLSRGEEMPSVEAYPQYDPYANEGAGNNAFSAPQGDRRRKDKKASRDKKAAGRDKKASKVKKEEKGGDEKKTKKEKKAEKPAKEKAAKAEKPAKEKKKAKGEKKLSSKMAAVSVER